jgi:membrane-bound lytic murein transglycosylase D
MSASSKSAFKYFQFPLSIRLMFLASCLTVALPLQAQSDDLFPRPAELEPAISFWVRVYTEVDTQSGFLHDSQNLSVIYTSLPLNRAEIESNRERIKRDLRILGSGRRGNLTSGQKEILDLWPADVSDQTLSNAANNVRWQLGQSDRFLGGLQRSGAYRQHIYQVVEEKNLPIELGVLPHVESSFNPGAYSSASAAGMWQFGRATGKRFMRIDHIVDERMDPYTATNAAMSLLQYNYSVLGTWPLALTAYNHGAAGIARAVRDTGTKNIETIIANYRGRAFGFASRNFYPQFLAVLEVERNAERFFGDVRFNPAPDFVEVTTDSYIDAEVFASSIGISLEQLQSDNRALRPVVWEGNKRIPDGFTIKVRRGAVANPDQLLAQIPVDFKFPVQTPDIAYLVERGDSLSVIANRFDTTVGRLVSLNQLASRNRISIGQRILLPQDNDALPRLPLDTPQSPPSDGIYTVRRGDTVSLIATRFAIEETELLSLNGIRDPHRIYPGQEVTLPGFEKPATQLAVIDTTSDLAPLVEVQFDDTEDEPQPEAVVEIADSSSTVIASTPIDVPEVPVEPEPEQQSEPVQLALNEVRLPPAAVLPDDQQLEMAVSVDDEQAVAVDPAFNVSQSNAELIESLSADPSDYSVTANNTVEIQASETLGHYADWLEIRAWDLRRLNNMSFSTPVIIGNRLSLDFSQVNIAEFELKRREFHSSLQREFFSKYRIQDVEPYKVAENDNVGSIARVSYNTPIWLLRQYNPNLDFNRIQIDQEIVFPLLENVE